MKIDRKTVKTIITILIVTTAVAVLLSIGEFLTGTIKRDVASIHITSEDGIIDYYTENPRQCKFFELYFDTFVSSVNEQVFADSDSVDVNKFALTLYIKTFSGFEYVILLRENQYNLYEISLNDIEEDRRIKDIPTMKLVKSENNVNYFTIDGVSDNVLSAFITSMRD